MNIGIYNMTAIKFFLNIGNELKYLSYPCFGVKEIFFSGLPVLWLWFIYTLYNIYVMLWVLSMTCMWVLQCNIIADIYQALTYVNGQ